MHLNLKKSLCPKIRPSNKVHYKYHSYRKLGPTNLDTGFRVACLKLEPTPNPLYSVFTSNILYL